MTRTAVFHVVVLSLWAAATEALARGAEVVRGKEELSVPGNLGTLEVEVREADKELPCRITIVDADGDLVHVYPTAGQTLALRTGVMYTPNGRARVRLAAGAYTIYANRGFEYGLDNRKVSISTGQLCKVRMRIGREVLTPGWAACDTHVHTLTYSGHGDATIDERLLTLAGEGIELPITTEHNMAVDYTAAAVRMDVEKYSTPVIGCEVTTDVGHFNVFPISAGAPVPDYRLRDWSELMESIRSTPDVQVAVLNHPRDFHNKFSPFAATNFNCVTGENLRGGQFTFDAVEVINSSALQSDLMRNYRDWFALLNHGYRVTAVGASDCHDVNLFIVGQGRSYVRCLDSNPAKINVAEACQSFRKGKVLVSLGLLAQMSVNERFGVGDLATGVGKSLRVKVTVLAPSWIQADRVELFANGTRIRECRIAPSSPTSRAKAGETKSFPKKIIWTIPRPRHDVYLVAIASGPGITAPYWPIPRPYQPTSPIWEPRVMASTNPIWIDGDGDGRFTAPRDYALGLVHQFGVEPKKLLPELERFDEAVAAQAASLCQATGHDVRGKAFMSALEKASEPVRRGFAAYAATLGR